MQNVNDPSNESELYRSLGDLAQHPTPIVVLGEILLDPPASFCHVRLCDASDSTVVPGR